MTARRLPRYPIYIPSKGRWERCVTAKALTFWQVPFHLVVEDHQADAYASVFGTDRLLVLPFRDQGSVIPARNWIKQHATEAGHDRHWQLDDNQYGTYRRYKGERIRIDPAIAMSAMEDFVDRYTNVAIAGPDYTMFNPPTAPTPPFVLNCRVYSFSLVDNRQPFQWRGTYNEDTDYCLQALSAGLCTILFKAFLTDKIATMTMGGGNTDEIYGTEYDGRLRMARSLERAWPGVVTTKRRFQRPQHHVKDGWKRFDTPLIRRPDLDLDSLPKVDERGMNLTRLKDLQGTRLQALADTYDGDQRK